MCVSLGVACPPPTFLDRTPVTMMDVSPAEDPSSSSFMFAARGCAEDATSHPTGAASVLRTVVETRVPAVFLWYRRRQQQARASSSSRVLGSPAKGVISHRPRYLPLHHQQQQQERRHYLCDPDACQDTAVMERILDMALVKRERKIQRVAAFRMRQEKEKLAVEEEEGGGEEGEEGEGEKVGREGAVRVQL